MDHDRNWRHRRDHSQFADGNGAGSGAFRGGAYNHWMAVRDHLPRHVPSPLLWVAFLVVWTLIATGLVGAGISKTTGHVSQAYSVITGKPASPLTF